MSVYTVSIDMACKRISGGSCTSNLLYKPQFHP
uniref:Uncharacterized protein n=1 Tax=Rhizophora mucronata TaxID=61149 RepID=A0A2P2NLE6_RHIMU